MLVLTAKTSLLLLPGESGVGDRTGEVTCCLYVCASLPPLFPRSRTGLFSSDLWLSLPIPLAGAQVVR